jgi:ankyrin repeat protein
MHRNHHLVAALKAERLDDVRKLLEQGADPSVEMDHRHNLSAVHWTVIRKRVQALQLLLTYGASVKIKDKVNASKPIQMCQWCLKVQCK